MALETERSSPSSASSPGPATTNSPSASSGTTYTKSISPTSQDVKPPIIHHPLAIYPATFQPVLVPQPRRQSPRQDEPMQVDGAPLRFSVSNILKPEFGRRAVEECRLRTHIESARSKSSRCSSIDDCRSFTSSPQRPLSPSRKILDDSDRHSGAESSIGSSSRPSSVLEDKLTDSGSSNKSANSLWPAWVYCTRYSDRPSSGEF
jgi:hypothetical protein